MLGAAHYELNAYDNAISSFDMAIDAGGLLPEESVQLNLNIAQLLIANGEYAKGAERLERLMTERIVKIQHIEMLTQAWIQAEQYQRALPWAEKWFAQTENKERKHFDTLTFLYDTLHRSDKLIELERMRDMHGNPN